MDCVLAYDYCGKIRNLDHAFTVDGIRVWGHVESCSESIRSL